MTDKTLQDRLRDFDAYFKPGARAALAEKAADALDAKDERIKALEGALREWLEAEDHPKGDWATDMRRVNDIMKRARALLGEK